MSRIPDFTQIDLDLPQLESPAGAENDDDDIDVIYGETGEEVDSPVGGEKEGAAAAEAEHIPPGRSQQLAAPAPSTPSAPSPSAGGTGGDHRVAYENWSAGPGLGLDLDALEGFPAASAATAHRDGSRTWAPTSWIPTRILPIEEGRVSDTAVTGYSGQSML